MKTAPTLLIALATSGVAFGQVIDVDINSSHRGWVDSDGSNIASNGNYISGQIGDTTYNSFFTFDLSGITGSIESASLELDLPTGGYVSGDTSELFAIMDVGSVVTSSTGGSTALFDDLGSGSIFGFTEVASGDSTVSVDLNSAFLSAINSGASSVTLGGSLLTVSGSPSTEYVFGFSETDQSAGAVRLALSVDLSGASVPEPSTTLLGGLAFAFGLIRRRR